MKLAIISDIHDNLPVLRQALALAKGTDALICCGDLCSPFVIKELGTNYKQDIFLVFGNNDGDLYHIAEQAHKYTSIHLFTDFADFSLGGKRIAIVHFESLARPVIASQWYDLVCFGHNHTYESGKEGKTLFINPGELSGVLSGTCSFVLFDMEKQTHERITISK